jgi:hypothetical protein
MLLGPYDSWLLENWHSPYHQDVALAASQCFEESWVRGCGGYAAEPRILSKSAFEQKLEILNHIYAYMPINWWPLLQTITSAAPQ